MVTMAAQKRFAGVGWGSFDDITPELPQKKPLPHQEAESEENKSDGNKMRRKPRGSHCLPPDLVTPMQAGGGACQRMSEGEAPPPGQVEEGGGGARALWKAMFPGNRKELKKRGGALPAERLRKKTSIQTRATGNDAIM